MHNQYNYSSQGKHSFLPHRGSVQFSSVAQSCPILCYPMNCRCQASLSITNSRSFPKLKSVEAVMPSSNLILCRPLSSFPQFFPASGSFPMSQFFAWGGQSIGFNFNISPSNENPGLISFRMDWLGLLTVLGTLKSPLQHHSSKASILSCSAFLSPALTSIHDHWKNHSLD